MFLVADKIPQDPELEMPGAASSDIFMALVWGFQTQVLSLLHQIEEETVNVH